MIDPLSETRRHSFIWEAEIQDQGSWYSWDLVMRDEEVAQRVLPLNVSPGHDYLHVWGESKHPMDWSGMREKSNLALQTGASFYSQEYRCFDKNGDEQWLLEEVQLEALEPGHWKAIGICTNITDRKCTEIALSRSEAYFRRLFDHSTDAIFVHDMDGRVLDANRRACESLGYTREELLELRIEDFEMQYDPERVARITQRLLSGGEATVQGTHRRKDGTAFPVEAQLGSLMDGENPIVLACVRDITERRQVEDALRESETRFREAMFHAPIGEALVSLDGFFLNANPALCRILGYSEEEFRLLTFQEITHPDDLDEDLCLIRQLLDGTIPSYQIEKRYHHKQGSLIWAELNVSLVRSENGHPLYFISQIQDISRQKRDEEDLRRLNEELFRMSRKDHLTGLRNRLQLQEDLEAMLDSFERYDDLFSVALCDVDFFKAYNNHYGHPAGDLVLQRIAKTLLTHCRAGDLAYRYGGEEFLLIFPHQAPEAAMDVMERLRREVENLLIAHEGQPQLGVLTVSGGVAGLSVGEPKTLNELLREADDALYRSKSFGRNRISRHMPLIPESLLI